MTRLHAYLLAGGLGTRLRPVTDDVPKPMLPYLSEPMLCGWLRRLAVAGVDHIHILIGPDARPFEEALAYADRLALHTTVHHEDDPLGSGGALREAASTARAPILVVNADVVTGVSITHLLRCHHRTRPDATILAIRHADPSDFGLLRTEGSRVVGFSEKPAGALGPAWINGGIYVLDPSVLQHIATSGPCDLEREVFPMLATGGHVELAGTGSGWADMGTPRRYLEAHRQGLAGEISWPPVRGTRCVSPGVIVHRDARVHRTAVLRAPALIGRGAEIGAQATVGPTAVVGRDARVGARASVTDAVLLDHATVEDGADVSAVLVGRTVVVNGPGAPETDRRARVA